MRRVWSRWSSWLFSRRLRGDDMARVVVQAADFDCASVLSQLRQSVGASAIGAVVSFVGLVRDLHDAGRVDELFIEHYPGMTERVLDDIVVAAGQRFAVLDVVLVHRYGRLAPGDQIVLVAVAATHRAAAFAACEFIVDFLKTEAPFWKQEKGPAGSHWVAPREVDDSARQRWENESGI